VLPVHLVVAVKEYKEQSLMQQATGIERLYKHNYYKQVLKVQHQEDNKILQIK
jgi:hypothetical protein